jgi:hypothetical protein
LYQALTTIADWALYAALVALIVMVPWHLVERRWRRHVQHEYDQLIARHHNLRDAHAALKAEQGALALMTEGDHDLLSDLAAEIQGCLATFQGEPLLDDAEAVNVATIPVPCIEIEYPDRLVTLSLAVEHYDAEEAGA